VNHLADIIIKRAELGKNYGVVLIPEGLIEFFPDVNVLISELNDLEGVS
jgi:6-phosphofructokinase